MRSWNLPMSIPLPFGTKRPTVTMTATGEPSGNQGESLNGGKKHVDEEMRAKGGLRLQRMIGAKSGVFD